MAQLHDPYAAPMIADLTGLPRLLMQSGSEDLCRHDAVWLAEIASRFGVSAEVDEWPGMFHVWHRFLSQHA